MAGNDSQKALLPALLFIFLAMLAVMFLFELAKQTINPGITTWESHVITIVFTSVLALVLVYFPLRSLHREHEKTAEALRLRQETEEKLQNTEAQYRSFVESVEDSIYTVDRDCRYLLINKRHLDRRGLSVRDYTGKTYGSFHTPAETQIFEEQVRQVVGSKSPVQAEYGRNGKYFLRNLYPVTDPGSGNVIAVTVISSDITDHKKAEEALALANKKLHLLLGHHPARHEQPAPDASFLSRPFGCVPFRSVADGGVHRAGAEDCRDPCPADRVYEKTTRSWESRLPHGRTSAHW